MNDPLTISDWQRIALDHFASREFIADQRDAMWWRSWFEIALAFTVGWVVGQSQ